MPIPIIDQAPGAPGLSPRWTSSAKSGVGTALSATSRVWFTLGYGIVNEIYYPRLDLACTRDFGLIVTDGKGFFSEEKRGTTHEIHAIDSGVPAFELVNTCVEGRYRITKRVIADPVRDVLLQHVRFEALKGEVSDYRLYALLAPHLVNGGSNNTGWLDTYKGDSMLFAEGDGTSLAVACSSPWIARSVGFAGASDGWQELSQKSKLTVCYANAKNGNIALTGEIDIQAAAAGVVIATGFGARTNEAAFRARASLQAGFDSAYQHYISNWRTQLDQARVLTEGKRAAGLDLYKLDVGVMLAHAPLDYPGALIASLSIPWGDSKGDDDLGGYHLVWPRDQVETAGGLLAAGLVKPAIDVLNYLQATQEADGRWPQNMWLDGTPYWSGVQLDECAFPILLVGALLRNGYLQDGELDRYLDMIRRAASFVLCNGPVTAQDRWEEDAGYSPFTLAVCITAMLAAAEMLGSRGDAGGAAFLSDSADAWNDSIERWTYVSGTDLAKKCGVEGYYVRIGSAETSGDLTPLTGLIAIKNRAANLPDWQAGEIIATDALALVRFGLRDASDPRMVDTVKVIDQLLKVDLPNGPVWRRYNEDGYGEHEDGRAFDGTGIGRGWPLLTGERAHYELAAGRIDEARRLLAAMEACASDGLLPEQVWDQEDIPIHGLYRGRPSGSAMPLVWAHSEHIKLLRSIADGQVFDMPPITVKRYLVDKITAAHIFWRFSQRCRTLPAGKNVRIEVVADTVIRWTADGWHSWQDKATLDSGLGLHYADLATASLDVGATVEFTLFWPQADHWEGQNFALAVIA